VDRPEGERVFFFEKKKQKTFILACGAPDLRGPKPREHQQKFLVLFQKEPFFPNPHCPKGGSQRPLILRAT
jgi:hypothetical protein